MKTNTLMSASNPKNGLLLNVWEPDAAHPDGQVELFTTRGESVVVSLKVFREFLVKSGIR